GLLPVRTGADSAHRAHREAENDGEQQDRRCRPEDFQSRPAEPLWRFGVIARPVAETDRGVDDEEGHGREDGPPADEDGDEEVGDVASLRRDRVEWGTHGSRPLPGITGNVDTAFNSTVREV